MPNWSANSIRKHCRRHLTALGALPVEFPYLEDWVVDLVKRNIAAGRLERLASGRTSRPSLDEYVECVVSHAHQEYARVRALERGEQAEWDRLSQFLLYRAISIVRRFHDERDPRETALDFVQQACAKIFEAHYPCDVPFEAWATRILKNLILAYYTRSSDTLHRPHESLDGPSISAVDNSSPLDALIADSSSAAEFEKVENQILLLDAMDRLGSNAQRQVIQWSYLDGTDDTEIARRLHKSKQAVYNLRLRALTHLSQILMGPARKNRQRISIK